MNLQNFIQRVRYLKPFTLLAEMPRRLNFIP